MSIKYKGETISGPSGRDGTDGQNGATFTPSVSQSGDLSWTNDGGLSNPATVNLKGPKGDKGDPGEDVGEIYSTEEVRIGTWIDGKPLYRRAFASTTPTELNTLLPITQELNEIDIVTKLTGTLRGPVGFTSLLSSGGSYIIYVFSSKTINAFSGNQAQAGRPLYITMEYTKTTDPATISQSNVSVLSSVDFVNISQASSAKSELTSIKSTDKI